jgi:nucleoside-diphosphate-sugar epimerase
MRVLMTGHTGYIGMVMAPFLEKAGHEVVGLDTDLFEACTFGEQPKPFPMLRKDLRDVTAADVKGFDAIIHLAGLSNDPLGNLNPNLTYDINHHASVKLAEAAKQAGVSRYLFSSSCSTYGAAGDTPLDESAEFNPVTAYATSKVLVEAEVSKMASDEFSPVFLRNATAYGASPRLRFDLVLNNLVAWAMCTGKVLMKSDGSPWRPLIHIEDISRAFLAALEDPREQVHNQAVNVGRNDQNYQIRDIAKVVEQTVPNCRIEFSGGAEPDKRNYRVNFDKIQKVLPAFKPVWDIPKGAVELYKAYQNVDLRVEDFEGVRYKRIDHIKSLIASGRLDTSLRWTGRAAEVAETAKVS